MIIILKIKLAKYDIKRTKEIIERVGDVDELFSI